jgi:hypothetical protein
MRLRNILIIVVLAAAAYFVIDSLSQPNPSTLRGNFQEESMYRNPNNTGPVVRIYAVSLSDTLWNEMEQYGEMMPYTKYGTTTVYFFKNTEPVPGEVSGESPHFDARFQAGCLARYHKDGMGFATLAKFPFSN